MVYVLVENGFEETELIVPVDILRRGGADVKIVGIGDIAPRSTRGVGIVCDALFHECDFSDMKMLFIPGGQPAVNNLIANRKVLDFISKIDSKVYLAAICAAPLVLDRAGVLEGKKVTCYPGCENSLIHGIYADATVVQSGNVITSKGPGTAFAFGFQILAANCGGKAAREVAKSMLVPEIYAL